MTELKFCTKCNIHKAKDNFFKGKYNHWCKECRYQWSRDNYKKQDPLDNKFSQAKRNYNIDRKTFDKLMSKKNCPICKRKFKELRDKNIDHCHNTDKIRDVLCGFCNKALGLVEDDTNILKSMISYLKKHSSEQ